jgi:hypothetical protein
VTSSFLVRIPLPSVQQKTGGGTYFLESFENDFVFLLFLSLLELMDDNNNNNTSPRFLFPFFFLSWLKEKKETNDHRSQNTPIGYYYYITWRREVNFVFIRFLYFSPFFFKIKKRKIPSTRYQNF